MSRTKVVKQRAQDDSTVNENIPVHLDRGRRRRRGEKRKDEDDDEEHLRGNVDGEAPSAQAKLGRKERLPRDAPPDHTPGGAHVAREQRRRREGRDRVERRDDDCREGGIQR